MSEALSIRLIISAATAASIAMIVCLTRKLTVEQVEAENMPLNEGSGLPPVPFGAGNQRWKEFLAQMQEGDELWEFISSPASWKGRSGRAGLTLIRDGEEVAGILTSIS